MPDWTQLHDVYNNTKDNFNPRRVERITGEIYGYYLPFGETICATCPHEYGELPPNCSLWHPVKYCPVIRVKDKRKFMHPILNTRSNRANDKTLTITIGTLIWNFHHGLDFIFRGCRENGLDLHHIDGNPFNNRFENVVLIRSHNRLHAQMKSISTSINSLISIAKECEKEEKKRIWKEVKRLSDVHKSLSKDIQDDPLVWKMIEIIRNVRSGHLPTERAHQMLHEMDCAFPPGLNKENFDIRTWRKNMKPHIQTSTETSL